MRIQAKLTGLDELYEEINRNIEESLDEAGEEAITYAKERGDYQNHTHNLRQGAGYGVVIGGELKNKSVPADAANGEAREKTEKAIEEAVFDGTGLIIADGMEYASFVEAKGYDVISGAALEAERLLQEKTRQGGE